MLTRDSFKPRFIQSGTLMEGSPLVPSSKEMLIEGLPARWSQRRTEVRSPVMAHHPLLFPSNISIDQKSVTISQGLTGLCCNRSCLYVQATSPDFDEDVTWVFVFISVV